MSYLSDLYRNFSLHQFDNDESMIIFQNQINIGSVVFIGLSGSGKRSILSSISETFSSATNHFDSSTITIKNSIFRLEFVDMILYSDNDNLPQFPPSTKSIVFVADISKSIPLNFLKQLQAFISSLPSPPFFHIFLHKVDLQPQKSVLESLKTEILKSCSSAIFHETSTISGSVKIHIGKVCEEILPTKDDLKKSD